MYLPFTTLYHDILQSCCGWFEQHVFSTLHLNNCKTIQNIRHLAIKEYLFALKNDKNASIISNEIPNYLRHISREIMSLVQHKEMWSYDVFKIHLKEKRTIPFLAGLFLVINIKRIVFNWETIFINQKKEFRVFFWHFQL